MPAAPLLTDLLDSFDIELRANGRADGTRAEYSKAVRLFIAWCEKTERRPDRDALARATVAAWLADRGTQVQPNTVRNNYNALRRFCRFLVDEGELDEHPMRTLEIPEPEIPLVPLFDDEDLVALIKACAGKRWQDKRDEAMLRVLLDCGVRVGGLCSMTVEATDLKREKAAIVSKGKNIMIYFSPKTTRALDRWLRARRAHKQASSPALWLSERGPLSRDGVRWIVRQRAEQAGITGPLNPHRFRHTWASDFLIAGGQTTDLKRLAGWDSDVMLGRYGAAAADLRAQTAARRLQRGDRI